MLAIAKDAFDYVYNGTVNKSGNEVIPSLSPTYYKHRFGTTAYEKNYNPASKSYAGQYKGDWPDMPSVFADVDNPPPGGYIKVKWKGATAASLMNKTWLSGGYYYIPFNSVKGLLEKVAAQKAAANQGIEDYVNSYNQLQEVINMTENDLPMNDISIPGMVATSMSVSYSNQFSSLPVLEGTTPTLQYMGSQDPYIQLSFEVGDDGLKAVNKMLEQIDYYSHEYRQGISVGFFGVKNQLADLFSIKTAMVENAQYATVPGFPGRNQVQMTLVAFNKTQRRAEGLAGFQDSPEGTNLADVTNNAQQETDDAIVEMRLRKMEVYPDLELPTYDELNTAIKKLGLKIDTVESQTGGVFVDPDFYVNTEWTFREVMKNDYLGDHALYLKDSSGLQVMTKPGSDKLVDTDEESWNIINNLTKTATKVSSAFSWGENSATAGDSNKDGVKDPVTYKSEEIGTYMLGKDDKGVPNYQKAPSFTTIQHWKWGMTEDQYNKWLKNPNPTEAEVWKYIYSEMTKTFKDNAKGIVMKNNLSKKTSITTAESHVAYGSSQALYALYYESNKDSLSAYFADDYKKLKKRLNPGGGATAAFKEPKVDNNKISPSDMSSYGLATSDTLTGADYNAYPFDRIFGMVKALFHFASKWKQFDTKGRPVLDSALNNAGIAGASVSDFATGVDQAQRLLWDWKYNIRAGLEKLGKSWTEIMSGKSYVDKIEYYSRPWETMIFMYANGRMPGSTGTAGADELGKDGVTNSVLDIFNRYYTTEKRWGTPTMTVNKDVYASVVSMTKQQKEFVMGTASQSDYIKYLVDDLDYRIPEEDFFDNDMTGKKSNGKYSSQWKKYLADHSDAVRYTGKNMNQVLTDKGHAGFTKSILNSMTLNQVKSIFNTWVKNLKEDKDWKTKHPILAVFKDIWDFLSNAPNPDATGDAIVETAGEYQTAIDNSLNNRLTGDDDPQQLYREMYTDLIQYDHRGRLIRAFPAFQMLIIDEGKWMGRFKFWDNMYGFNSIESIDVYRSRKIAADTAVIRMTNLYSNLTSQRVIYDYEDHQANFWTNLIWENPTQDMLDMRKEMLKQMLLQTGARIHLRMGYGSDAGAMPIVFNGTITEMDTQEVVEIVCQGDGVELGNVVSGDPDDDNNGFFQVTEPRDLICQLLTSKGNWFANVINEASGGVFMRDNPLGIMHFGVPGSIAPSGNVWMFNTNYGEAAQNVYSSNGTPTFSQWANADGTNRNLFTDTWNTITTTNITRWFQPGDEDNIIVKFYNNTTWDIIQTLTYCSLDYVAAVHPFETRSTLFFGKPYWRMAYSYNSEYQWDEGQKAYVRKVNTENRRPFMQFRYYDSRQDIIQNSIKASSDGIFTNVIVNYDGQQTPILSADYDIRYDKQTTQVIDAEIVARFPGVDYWTSEHQARNYGMSALRDSLKDMYKGAIVTIADPSVKPHDAMYIADYTSSLNGVCLVKAVTHHMSLETGFVSSIEPDAYVVNDDLVMLSIASWYSSVGMATAGLVLSLGATLRAVRMIQQSKVIGGLAKGGKGVFHKLEETGYKLMLDWMGSGSYPEMEAYKKAFDAVHALPNDADAAVREKAIKALDKAADDLTKMVDGKKQDWKNAKKLINFFNKDAKDAKEAFKNARLLSRKAKAISTALRLGKASKGLIFESAFNIGKAAFGLTGIGFLIEIGLTVATESIFEMYARYKEALQCVSMIPLQYKGRELTAGINGHMGMVVGDNPGKLDKLVSGVSDSKDTAWADWIFETANWLSGSSKDFSVTQSELAQSPSGKPN
jgi:hypothetical protein